MNSTFTLIQRLRPRSSLCFSWATTGTGSGYQCRKCIMSLSMSTTSNNSQQSDKKMNNDIKAAAKKTKTKTKPWNEAACVMAVAPMNNSEPYSLGYLMVERSGTGRVMPGNWVYPGGNADKMDADLRWITLFKDIQNMDIVQERILQDGAKIPEIYLTGDEGLIPKEISMRITAVREMFEEAGILLCRPRKVDPAKHLHNGMLHYEFPALEDKKVLQEWQKKVRKDASTFADLCKELDCVPDIHALYDWSNWLTPTYLKGKKTKVRFDTMNYMLIIPRMPRVVIDGNEAVKAQWASPSSILADHASGQARLMPPQLYEMKRLIPIKTIGDLKQRLDARRRLGIERFFPVVRKAVDGTLFLLPGDDLYPASPDYIGTEPPGQDIDKTIAQSKEIAKHLHRGIATTEIDNFEVNVERYGHIY